MGLELSAQRLGQEILASGSRDHRPSDGLMASMTMEKGELPKGHAADGLPMILLLVDSRGQQHHKASFGGWVLPIGSL